MLLFSVQDLNNSSLRRLIPLPALLQAARGGRGGTGLLGLPRRDALGGLLDVLGAGLQHGVDEVDDGLAGGDVCLRDLGGRAGVGLDDDVAGLGGEVDRQVGLGEPRLDDGAVLELVGL